ncbi:MAG: hypothetical protein ACE5I2_11350, partial [Anaerolineae bacterium]
IAVLGESSPSITFPSPAGMVGVYGIGDGKGVYGTGATGVEGESTDGTGVRGHSTNGDGVVGQTTAADKSGVYGQNTNGVGVKGRSDNDSGVVGWTGASDKSGVFGHSQVGIGVTGRSDGGAGVVAVTTSSNSDDVALVARNEGSGSAIYAESGTNGLAALFNGRISTHVLEITGGSDLSELFEIRGARASSLPSPGMVVSIDPENPGDLIVSDKAYDRRVAGIVSGAGSIQPGMLMRQASSAADGSYPVALTGRVYCWADASNGPIEPGDLLTTSNIPGHAMKVADYAKAQGAIIGKAMTGLTGGKGLVLVLVSLQ